MTFAESYFARHIKLLPRCIHSFIVQRGGEAAPVIHTRVPAILVPLLCTSSAKGLTTPITHARYSQGADGSGVQLAWFVIRVNHRPDQGLRWLVPPLRFMRVVQGFVCPHLVCGQMTGVTVTVCVSGIRAVSLHAMFQLFFGTSLSIIPFDNNTRSPSIITPSMQAAASRRA